MFEWLWLSVFMNWVKCSDLLVIIGGSEVVFFVFVVCLDLGDEILVFDLMYVNYMGYGVMLVNFVVFIFIWVEDGYYLLEDLDVYVILKIKVVLLCNFVNFIGVVYIE